MASGTIQCTVVRTTRSKPENTQSNHDLLPWADPYIASLFRDLERHEQEERERKRLHRTCVEQVLATEPTPILLEAEFPTETRWPLYVA